MADDDEEEQSQSGGGRHGRLVERVVRGRQPPAQGLASGPQEPQHRLGLRLRVASSFDLIFRFRNKQQNQSINQNP